jgi:hypothetical protein
VKFLVDAKTKIKTRSLQKLIVIVPGPSARTNKVCICFLCEAMGKYNVDEMLQSKLDIVYSINVLICDIKRY